MRDTLNIIERQQRERRVPGVLYLFSLLVFMQSPHTVRVVSVTPVTLTVCLSSLTLFVVVCACCLCLWSVHGGLFQSLLFASHRRSL